MIVGDQKPSDVPKSWPELSRRRSDWAIRAYDRFMESLSEETRERFPSGDENGEAYVVVFGTTQVGKTTLLLDLMGVAVHASARVAQVLRGGRDQGKSATATAMEYRRSPEEDWQLNDGGRTDSFDNDGDMEKALAALRERMSRRAIRALKPVMVGIPKSCFLNGNSCAPRVRMLDLPGANAAEVAEREHVDEMAKRYVPHADLILLVGRGDDLSFLRPVALALPGIEDWQIVPTRFRIVTTYSYTPKSLREAAKRHSGALDATFFRQRLLDQIDTYEYKLSADSRKLDLYFPLEIGDSWLQAQQSGDELVETVGPIIEALKKQLHEDISRSVSKMARLKNAFDVYLVVGRIKAERLSKMKDELKQLEEGRARIKSHFDRAVSALEQAQSEMQKDEKYLQLLPMEEILRDVDRLKTFDIEGQLALVDKIGKNIESFRICVTNFTSTLTGWFLSWRPPQDDEQKKIFWWLINPRFDSLRTEVVSFIGKEFSPLHRDLDLYLLDDYYPGISDQFSADQDKLRNSMRNSAKMVGKIAHGFWHSLAGARKDDLYAHLVETRATVATLVQALKREEAGLAEKDTEIDCQNALLADFSKKMDVEMENGKSFQRFLDQEYLAELNMRRAARQKEKGAAAAFLNLLATYELIGIRNKLLLDVNENAT